MYTFGQLRKLIAQVGPEHDDAPVLIGTLGGLEGMEMFTAFEMKQGEVKQKIVYIGTEEALAVITGKARDVTLSDDYREIEA